MTRAGDSGLAEAGPPGGPARRAQVETATAFGLARGMARTVGADLATAVAAGRVPRTRLHALVDGCQRCPVADACLTWLAEARREPPPAFCPAREAFLALARVGGPPASRV
jgi:hypothetical protein